MMDQSHQLIKIFCGSKMMEHQHHVNNGKCTESQVNSMWIIHISQSNFLYISIFLKILLSRKSCWCFLFCCTTSTNQWRRNSNCHCCWSFLCSKTWIGLDRRSKRKSKLNNRAIKWIQFRTTGKILIFKSQFWSILLVGISMFISMIWQWMERRRSKLTRG